MCFSAAFYRSPGAWEQMFETANRRSFEWQIRTDLSSISTAFFVPGGTSEIFRTRENKGSVVTGLYLVEIGNAEHTSGDAASRVAADVGPETGLRLD